MDAIVVFDPQGKFVRSFGKEYHGGGHGIDIRKEDGQEFLYLCDVKNRLVAKSHAQRRAALEDELSRARPGVYQKLEQFNPTNVAFAPDGGFYVGDGYGSNYIHQYDKDAKWVRTWGGAGTEDRQDAHAARHLARRSPGPRAGAGRGRSGQRPAAILHARRQVHLSIVDGRQLSRPTSTSAAASCWCPTCTPA